MREKTINPIAAGLGKPALFHTIVWMSILTAPFSQAHIFFDNSMGSMDFGIAENWSTDLLPSAAGTQNAFIGENHEVLFTGTMTTVGEIQVGTDAAPFGNAGIPGGRASLTLNSGANLTLGVNQAIVIGQGKGVTGNSGIVQVNTGAALNLSGSSRIYLGFYDDNDSGSTTGTLHINGGTVTKTGSNGIEIGGWSSGDPNNYGKGALLMDAGTLDSVNMVVGWNGGVGQVTQAGGDITLTGFFTMGIGKTGANPRHGSGIYDMSGGTFTANQGFGIQEISDVSTTVSSFNQSGGVVNLNGTGITKAIGRSAAGTGIYNLSKSGVINISNGDLQVAAITTGATGVLNISGDSQLNLNGIYALAVGRVSNSTGTVNQMGGAVTIARTSTFGVWLGATAGATATYNLKGGTLTTSGITPAAVASTKAFNFDGGELIANKSMTIATATNFTTTINTSDAKINTAGFDVTWNPALLAGTGRGGLVKSGVGTLTLAGENTYTGDTKVIDGVLAVSGTSIIDSGKLVLDGGMVHIPASSNETVNTLYIGSIEQAAGTYGSTLSDATFTDDDLFSGEGMLTVTAIAGGYANWAMANVGGASSNVDTDADGVQNGVEYFLNAAPGFTVSPTVVESVGPVRTVSWTNGGNIPSTAYGIQFVLQTSPDLFIWTDVPFNDSNLSNASGAVGYTLPAASGKIFLRLSVTPQ